jgi:hypothetical protein
MKTYGGVEVQLDVFFTVAPTRMGEWRYSFTIDFGTFPGRALILRPLDVQVVLILPVQ